MSSHYKAGYSFTDKDFLLSPEAAILRNLAESLYPVYLSRLHREGKELTPYPVPALDDNFVASSEALWFRVLSETIYAEIMLRRQKIQHTVLWFGSARLHTDGHEATVEMRDYYQESQDLAQRLTEWGESQRKEGEAEPFMICTGGGPGIMEAGNRGAQLAKGRSIGLNIQLPAEQKSNTYIPDELLFNFQYFFTRKFHFLKRAKVALVFPGGFGSMDELFETLTLIQTGKIDPIKIILFGTQFWKDVLNIEKLVEYGTISKSDLELFEYQDDIDSAFNAVVEGLKPYLE